MNVHLLPYSNKRSQNFINTVTNYVINFRTEEIRKYHPYTTKHNGHDPIWGVTIGCKKRVTISRT